MESGEILPTRSASLEGMIMVIDDIMFKFLRVMGKVLMPSLSARWFLATFENHSA